MAPAIVTPTYEGEDRRVSNGNGFLSGIPPWAKVVAFLASTVGIPGLIAFYLVWMGGQILPIVQADLAVIKAQHERSSDHDDERDQRDAEQTRLLQRICSRVSKTDAERSACFDR